MSEESRDTQEMKDDSKKSTGYSIFDPLKYTSITIPFMVLMSLVSIALPFVFIWAIYNWMTQLNFLSAIGAIIALIAAISGFIFLFRSVKKYSKVKSITGGKFS